MIPRIRAVEMEIHKELGMAIHSERAVCGLLNRFYYNAALN